ncbi:MAG: aminotransferase class I/II-fold pyridoxal phosphate-dependent enzyme [Acidobacteria bacterium]|nr:aminotransferase class I/II-fold pyridoxal phosphate-dependent enzyme [Acidobacteriota bacterium]
MAQKHDLNRRSFLKRAGITAFAAGAASAVGSGSLTAVVAAAAADVATGGKFDFDTPYSRVGTDSVKWDQQIRSYKQPNLIAGMGIADQDFRAAPCIAQALAERCKHENWGYLDMPKDYIEAIVAWNKKRYNLDIDPETVVLTTGVHPGLISALRAFAPPGSKVLLNTPTYNGFYGDLRYTGTIPEDVPMRLVNGRYSIDFDEFEHHISRDTNVYILCNPQNPTGNHWSPEDLTRIGEICLRRRVLVLADEIHCDFVNKGQKYTPFASLPNKDIVNNSITFKAASKSFSLAAMKNAWYFSTNPDLLSKARAMNRADITTLGMVANKAVLTQGADWLDQLLPYIDANHDLVDSYIRANMPLVKTVKPQGTYLSWLDISAVADRIGAKQKAASMSKAGRMVSPETVVQDWFADNAKVALNAGSSYGTGGENHMRMNIATSRKTLQAALESMSMALKKI